MVKKWFFFTGAGVVFILLYGCSAVDVELSVTNLPSLTDTLESYPSPTETATPTESPQTPEEVIFQVAEFSGNAEIISANGKLTINYSDAVLDKRNIQTISMNPEALDKVHSLIVNNTYNSAGEPVGSEIPLSMRGRSGISGVVDNIRQYTVSYEEYPQIQTLLQENGFEFLDYEYTSTSKASLFFAEDGSLVVVTHSFQLRTPSPSWDREDVDVLALHDGPAYLFVQITTSAIYGNTNLSNRKLPSVDPVWIAMRCTERCAIDGTEEIEVVFNN